MYNLRENMVTKKEILRKDKRRRRRNILSAYKAINITRVANTTPTPNLSSRNAVWAAYPGNLR